MHKLLKLIGASVYGLGAVAVITTANAADPARGGTSTMGRNAGRVGTLGTTAARMPTMPILPGGSVGTISPDVNKNPVTQPSKCDDGGVVDSEYTVENCMNDVAACVNGGALPGGINDLFSEDMRNAIMNGMGLCSVQVERCISDVRKNCRDLYTNAADVWADFNSRRIQPEYYNFVLRKTGLTPNQAENTCLLLDRNTFGSSFAAVSKDGNVTMEYDKRIGAYNGQNVTKNNTMGVTVNRDSDTVDGVRGHYARWDAVTATCLVRVAAYNKGKAISNTWLFGALGDDKPAEAWKAAGDTFKCNKDLFGFSLMNNTSTVAVVGVGGGTLAGAGVGAIIGHGKRNFDCENKSHLKELSDGLRGSGRIQILNTYLAMPVSTVKDLDKSACEGVVNLYNKYQQLLPAVSSCNGSTTTMSSMVTQFPLTVNMGEVISNVQPTNNADGSVIVSFTVTKSDGNTEQRTQTFTKDQMTQLTSQTSATADASGCAFKTLKKSSSFMDGDIYCTAGDAPSNDPNAQCLSTAAINRQLADLKTVFDSAEILEGEDSNMGKSIGFGALAGAGAGGLATAITAFTEKNNISCHVGDGLDKVAYGKSGKIDTLKDFYVKWNLQLPDTAAPTVTIDKNCDAWRNACAKYTDRNQCRSVGFGLKNENGNIEIINNACTMYEGSTLCVENRSASVSAGVCQ